MAMDEDITGGLILPLREPFRQLVRGGGAK